jgi:hypothetical protein
LWPLALIDRFLITPETVLRAVSGNALMKGQHSGSEPLKKVPDNSHIGSRMFIRPDIPSMVRVRRHQQPQPRKPKAPASTNARLKYEPALLPERQMAANQAATSSARNTSRDSMNARGNANGDASGKSLEQFAPTR